MKSLLLALALTFGTVTHVFAADVASHLQAVVQRADEAQAQALARNDPGVMRDTATADYFRQLVETNRALAGGGVQSIELVKIEWGGASVDGDTARLIADETWRTVYADGTTVESRDRNVYTLVRVGGAWKIQDDQHPGAVDLNGPAPTGPGQSRNWSGYAADGGNFTSVTGTWTVPAAGQTGSYGADAAWVGIGGLGTHDLIQAGTSGEVAPDGRVRYQAWVETLPAPPRPIRLAVRPGDSVTFTVAETTPDRWLITAVNTTTGRSTTVEEQYQSSHASAEWIEEAPAAGRRVLPPSDFGTVRFTGGSAVKDGKTVTVADAGAQPLTMIDDAGRPIAMPSALSADGASFAVTHVDRLATAQPPNRAPVRTRHGRG